MELYIVEDNVFQVISCQARFSVNSHFSFCLFLTQISNQICDIVYKSHGLLFQCFYIVFWSSTATGHHLLSSFPKLDMTLETVQASECTVRQSQPHFSCVKLNTAPDYSPYLPENIIPRLLNNSYLSFFLSLL